MLLSLCSRPRRPLLYLFFVRTHFLHPSPIAMSAITSHASTSLDSTASPTESRSLPAYRRNLPTELLSTILAMSLGSHFRSILSNPDEFYDYRHIKNLLLVSHTFYAWTVEVLYHLWGSTFIDVKER